MKLGDNPFVGDEVVLSNQTLFTKLRRSYPDNSVNPTWFQLHISYEEVKAVNLFAAVRSEINKTPVADFAYALKNKRIAYNVRVERIAEDHDLDNASWLYFIAPKLSLAKFKAVEPDDSYVVTKVTSKKKIAFGCTDHVGWMMLFSEGLKDKFLDSGLCGLGFQSVKLENGSPSGLWQIASPARMPPLAMQLTDGQGNPFTGDGAKACCVDEGSYFPMVLKYRVTDLAEVPKVDVIMSAERIGDGHNAHRMHIVSQRFRQVAEKLAPGMFSYGLVAVGEGEELQTRYTIPELAPPRDAT